MVNFDFFQPREKFLILKIKPENNRFLFLGIDGDKKIHLEKFRENVPLSGLSPSFMSGLGKRRIILAADPSVATTIFLPLNMERAKESIHKPITDLELEDSISRVMGRTFSQNRAEAAKELGLDELDTILVSARVADIEVDRHAVLDALGAIGARIGGLLELTFTNRDVFENLQQFLNSKNQFFFTESARANIALFRRLSSPPVSFLSLGLRRSEFFLAGRRGEKPITRGILDWSFGSIVGSISGEFGTSDDASAGIYGKYLNNDLSPSLRRHLDRVLRGPMELFAKEIKKSGLRGMAYVHSPMPLPFGLPHKLGRLSLNELPLNDVLGRSGFGLSPSFLGLDGGEIFMSLAPFFEFYHDKGDSEINHRLRRRVHWLIK
ncbi:MAG: hypothetical protein AAB655_02620 [Patescibacteria group bacterium]